MSKERKQYAITPKMKIALEVFWVQYKEEHNIDDSILVVLIDGRMTIKQIIAVLQRN